MVRSHNVVEKSSVKVEIGLLPLIGIIFNSTYHTEQLNPWPTSPDSHVVVYNRLSACPGKMEPFKVAIVIKRMSIYNL